MYLFLGKLPLCARVTCLVWPTVTLKDLVMMNSARNRLYMVEISVLVTWKDVDQL